MLHAAVCSKSLHDEEEKKRWKKAEKIKGVDWKRWERKRLGIDKEKEEKKKKRGDEETIHLEMSERAGSECHVLPF